MAYLEACRKRKLSWNRDFGSWTYKDSIVHKGQSRQNNKCNLEHIVPAAQ